MPLFSRLEDDGEQHKVTVTKSKRTCCCQATVTKVDESVAKLRQKRRKLIIRGGRDKIKLG